MRTAIVHRMNLPSDIVVEGTARIPRPVPEGWVLHRDSFGRLCLTDSDSLRKRWRLAGCRPARPTSRARVATKARGRSCGRPSPRGGIK